jgi:hypothetical protein
MLAIHTALRHKGEKIAQAPAKDYDRRQWPALSIFIGTEPGGLAPIPDDAHGVTVPYKEYMR